MLNIKKDKSTLVMLSGFLSSIIALIIFSAIAEDVLENETLKIDLIIINWLHSFQGLDSIMFWITESGSITAISLFSALIFYHLYHNKKQRIDAYFFILTVAVGGILNYVLKIAFHRVRPSIDFLIDAVGFSFPSGHSMGSMVFYGALSYFILKSERNKKLKFILVFLSIIMVLLVGSSRIYLNAHYPSDVIAGYIAGFVWLMSCIYARRVYKHHKFI